jgi:predicted dehydrogenase
VLGIATVRDRGRDHAQLFPDVHPALMTAIHDIDLALWITGARAVRVTAQGRGEKVDDMPRLVWANVEASDGSVWALRVSWLLSNDAPSSDRLDVYGTAGVATLDLRPTVALFTESSGWIDHELTPDAHPGALDHEIDHFCALLRSNGRTPAVTLVEARHGIQIAEAMMRSIETGGASTELSG